MTVIYLGEYELAGAIPGAASMATAGITGINSALPDIVARIAALQAFAPSPTNFAQQIVLAQGVITSVQASIALGLPVPSIDAQIAAVLALVASLLSQLTAINAALSIVTDFKGLLASAGVHVFSFTGSTGAFGSELSASISTSPIGGLSSAIVLATDVSNTWLAMGSIFRVSP